MNTEEAFSNWAKIPGLKIESEKGARPRFDINTIMANRRVLGVLKTSSIQQVQEIVRIANAHKVPLYPISGGKNWGYGSALPATDNCVVLDLSEMNRINEFSDVLGYVVLEPGVNQDQLYAYIQKHKYHYMVPTTGAGGKGSIIGNALEKGYGITPEEDHFGAVLSIKAVLPDGSIYQSALAELGGHRSDAMFKWKIGPYLDGLFAQGNIGIVVQATIALARKPALVKQFLAFVDDEHFEDAVTAVSNIKQQFGSMLGGVNMMNKRRLLAMVESQSAWEGGEVLSEMEIRKLAKNRRISDWVVMGALYVPEEMLSGASKCIRNEFGSLSNHLVFLDRRRVGFVSKILSFLPYFTLKDTIASVERSLSILEGVPNSVALALAYMKNRGYHPGDKERSPDEDRCGLIWYSPLLPIDASLVRDFTQEITRVCLSQNIEPLITLTAISERCFDSTIPILFDQNNSTEVANAHRCHELLLELSKEMGIFPYRVDINTMRKVYDNAEGTCFTMLEQIKKAIDPNNIIAPGRYSRDVRQKHQQ